MFHASNVDIRGQSQTFSNTTHGNIYNSYSQRSQGFELLLQYVATEAFHNSGEVFDQPKCHPGTRVAILESLYAWAAALAYVFAFKWVHGPAGSGKSAIMRTLAEMLEKHGLLLATFFFFRASPNRNTARLFIPTIAYQLCSAIPEVKPLVESTVKAHPLIFSQSLETQARLLIVMPLRHLHKTGALPSCHPRILIIDGLDECLDPDRQIEVLRILIMILSELPISLAIFIASRPEPHIGAAFNNGELNQLSSRLVLDDSYEPDADIRKFFEDKFLDIRTKHYLRSYLPNPWPPPAILNLLVRQASGQFIFASTVIKFVEPPRHNPAERLDIILSPDRNQRGEQKPFEPLDTLYSTILCLIPPDELPEVLRILGILLVPHPTKNSFDIFAGTIPTSFFPSSIVPPNCLASLLGTTVSAIRQHLYDLESLLQVNEDDEDIEIFHASLADFVFDKFRSDKFYVNPAMIYEELCRKCTQILYSSSDTLLDVYMMHNFRHHLQQATPTPTLHRLVKNCDINSLPLTNHRLHQVFPEFLYGIQASKFHDASELYSQLIDKYKEFISQQVDVYFERGLSYLLPLASDRYWAQFCARSIQFSRGIDVAVLLAVPDNALDLLDSYGGLPVLKLIHHNYYMHLLPRKLVTEILAERIHSCYAQIALLLLKHIVHPRSEESHVSNRAQMPTITRPLEKVVSMAAPQLELAKFIQKHSLDSDVEDKPQIEAMLAEYVSRTEVHFRSQMHT